MGNRVKTVCVYLGANRSLTTISSAMLALHPDVTVMNHGFGRLFDGGTNDFILDPRQQTLDSFADTASELALGGERGPVGGHILHSHAFDDVTLRTAYLDRYGWDAKPRSSCLLWKDATRATKHMLDHDVPLDELASKLPALRFVMLVRNPVDICISSINKNHSSWLVGEERKDSIKDVFIHIIKLFAWFSAAASTNERQFRFLYQDEIVDRAKLIELCDFLDISADEIWLDEIARLIQLRPSYPITEAQRTGLKKVVHSLIPDPFVARRVADQIV